MNEESSNLIENYKNFQERNFSFENIYYLREHCLISSKFWHKILRNFSFQENSLKIFLKKCLATHFF